MTTAKIPWIYTEHRFVIGCCVEVIMTFISKWSLLGWQIRSWLQVDLQVGATFWWAAAPSTGRTAHTEEGLHTLNANVMQSVETLKLKWRLSLQNKKKIQINWLIIENLLQVAIIITLIKHIINHFTAHIKKNSMRQVVFWLLVLPLGWYLTIINDKPEWKSITF